MSYIWEGDDIYYLINIKSIFFIFNIFTCILYPFSGIFHLNYHMLSYVIICHQKNQIIV